MSLEFDANLCGITVNRLRKIAACTGIKKSAVHVILKKKLKFHPNKMQIMQFLNDNDYSLRETLARTMLERFRTAGTLGNILFTDEAHFHIDGYVNKQYMRYWSPCNPRERHQKRLHCPKTTVWCAISARGIIGPYFFNQRETVTAEVYCQMIDEFLVPQLQLFPGFNNRTQFQQDGATPPTARVSMEKLRVIFPNKLISKYGDIPWAPRSPDLTPCDFFCGDTLSRGFTATIPEQFRPYKKISAVKLLPLNQRFALACSQI